MPDYLTQLLQNSSSEEILEILKDRLDKSDEADFWKEKIIPFTDAILSILIPLKK
jgi:Cdc6-like AAA superfamily ATPase